MQTFAIVVGVLLAALAIAAVAGRFWLLHLVNRPVRPALAGQGAGCEGCPSVMMMAAQGGGSGSRSSGGSASPRGPNRRTFLRGALGVSALGAVGGFGAASLAFLWPDVRGGFGAVLDVDDEENVLNEIDENGGRLEYSPGRALLVRYDPEDDPEGQYAELTGDQSARVMALYQVCVHLGCSVPWCDSSGWWECPCHGSQYNRWGEWMGGPAPRGLDRFRVEVDDGRLMLDTSEIITGPSRGERTLQEPPEGAHCT